MSAVSIQAQEIRQETPSAFAGLDVHPQYPGPESFQQYVMSYVKGMRLHKSQRIYVSFVVEKDGSLSNATFSDGTEEKMKKKILKAFKKCKKWSPGIQDNKPVRVSYTLPITISIK